MYSLGSPIDVFIDTQALRSISFDWNDRTIQSLRQRVKKNSLNVLTTDVVVRECHRQVASMINELRQSIDRTEKKSQFIKSINPDYSEKVLQVKKGVPNATDLRAHITDFFGSVEAQHLAYPLDSKALFDLYFEGAAPFGAKGKKSEFPDAANLLSLEAHIHQTKRAVMVVSDDEDWARVGANQPNIVHVRTLSDALSRAIRLEWTNIALWSDEELLLHLARQRKALEIAIGTSLERTSQVNLGDGRLEHLTIHEVTPIHYATTDIWHMDDDLRCRGELSYELSFTAEISLGDAEFNDVLDQDVTGSEELVCQIDFWFRPDNPADVHIEDLDHIDGLYLELNMDIV